MATAAEPAAEPAAESINFDHIFAKFDVNKDGRAPQRLKPPLRHCVARFRHRDSLASLRARIACGRHPVNLTPARRLCRQSSAPTRYTRWLTRASVLAPGGQAPFLLSWPTDCS